MKSIITRIVRVFRPIAVTTLANDPDYDAHEELRRCIRHDLASGFYDNRQVLQQAIEYMGGEMEPELLKSLSATVLEQELFARAADQRDWPAITDCDKLDTAFAELEAQGIIARQNFSCCGTCGSAEIWDEAAALEVRGTPVRGYAFYHMQDTDSAIDGSGIYLNYGATEEGEVAATRIAHEIVARLEAHGFQVDWDGTWNKRVGFAIDWKRRSAPLNAA